MNWIVTIYAALLFFILTPAVLVRLPPKGGKYTVAAFHALVFALVFHFTAKMVWQVSKGLEGFQEGARAPAKAPAKAPAQAAVVAAQSCPAGQQFSKDNKKCMTKEELEKARDAGMAKRNTAVNSTTPTCEVGKSWSKDKKDCVPTAELKEAKNAGMAKRATAKGK